MISVILTTYNGEKRGYLKNSIESVLNQTYDDYELILIDDGSKDNTKKICKNYLNNRKVKYYFQENKGLSAARNLGIRKSSGIYICFLDDDDEWVSNKLEEEVKFFEDSKDKKIGMVFTSLNLINEHGEKIGKQSHYAKGDIYERLFYENLVDAPSSVMIKKEVFDKVGVFKEYMYSDEDNDMWIRISKEYNIYSINKCLVNYRVHSNKMSADNKKMEFYQLVTFYNALNEATQNIKKNEDEIYYNLYMRFANKHFLLRNYKEFRKYYKISKAYSNKINILMRIKYSLSFFPGFIRIVKKIR